MKMMKGKKKFIMAFIALLVAGITLAVTLIHDSNDVAATTAVFDGITAKYTNSKSQVNILEIVPVSVEHEAIVQDLGNKKFTINEGSELGYFMTSNLEGDHMGDSVSTKDPEDPIAVTQGGVHGVPLKLSGNIYFPNSGADKTSDEFKATLMNFYEYGLIKPSGVDGGYYTKLGEYPIYAHTAVFSQFNNGLFTQSLSSRLVNGYYTVNPTGTGNYSMDDDLYGINESDNYRIYDVTVSRNSLGEIETVSYNSIVSVDTTSMSLPKKTDGTPIITYDPNGHGNLDFHDVEGVAGPYELYKGYSVANGALGNVYYSVSDQTKYHSSDWWNEYVLGDLATYENANLKTPLTVKAANEVTEADIDAADLIYISGTYDSYITANVDLKPDVMTKIYNDEINYKHKAVMMDYALYNDALGNNISKLALLLWQNSQMATYKSTAEEHPTWFSTATVTDNGKDYDVYLLNQDAWNDSAFVTYLKENKVPAGTGNGNFVTGNTYVYNHHMSDFKSPKSMVDALDNFANGDFNTPYSDQVVAAGFTAVSKYIETSNANAITKMVSNSISPAVCIQYILVSTGADLDAMKLTLNVLEIEPVPAFLYNTARGSREYSEFDSNVPADAAVIENRKAFVDDYLTSFYGDRIQFIHFTSMTIYEFNARNEDLVENYDIIYIGDETTRNGSNLYYTDGPERYTLAWNDDENDYGYKQIKTSNIPNFNDENMVGNLYYNVGDIAYVFGSFQNDNQDGISGWLDTDTYRYQGTMKTRYSPRDLTKNNLAKLKEFVQSKALVLVAEDLMGTTTGDVKNTQINPTIVEGNEDGYDIHGRVDSSSNLYEFLNFALGKTYTVSSNGLGAYVSSEDAKAYENVVAVSDIKQKLVDKELLAEYVSTEKLELYLIDKPVEYSYIAEDSGKIVDTTKLTTIASDGTRYLEYKFMIVADNETTAEAGYSVTLYIDINKDGKFSKTTESVQDYVLRLADGSEANKNEANEYVLAPNVEYTLRRDIAEDFSGLLNWKLDIKSNAISHLHDSQTGYTLVKDPSGQKKKIRILQITNGNTKSSYTLDMEARLYKARTENSTNSWSLLMNNVPDYELFVRTISVSEYETAFDKKYTEYKTKADADNDKLEADGKEKIKVLTKSEYAAQAYDTFFKEFVVQNVTLDNCSETPKNHSTKGPNKADVKASTLQSKGYVDEIGVDMIVCGFGDDYQAFSSTEAMAALEAFIKAGKPVLTTHDFVHLRVGTSQNRVLRNLFGADLYGVSQNLTVTNDELTAKPKVKMFNAWQPVTVGKVANEAFRALISTEGQNYLHSGVGYSRAANADVFAVIENTGKEVAYQPNSTRNLTTPETQGISSMLIEWNRDNGTSKKSWLNAKHVAGGKSSWNSGGQNDLGDNKKYMVEQVNEGQLTNYPYRLQKSFRTTATHSQYYSLDLTSDLDNDGESDVVVWYALGDSNDSGNGAGVNPYSETTGGSINPANGYYIYNDGNITYTGAGHKDLTDAGLDEVELFINTLIAAYSTGVSDPSVGFYNSPDINEKPITSLIVPYDGNVTNPDKGSGNAFDSSILRKKGSTEYMYKFVDPNTEASKGVTAADGTMIYYRVGDYNFIRGTKDITTRYYLQVPSVVEDEENNKLYYIMPDGTKLDVVSLKVDGVTVSAVDISNRINTYATSGMLLSDTAMERNKDGSISGVESGRAYGFYLPMNLLNDNASFTILVEAQTTITSISTSGYGINTRTEKVYEALPVVKADLLDLD